MDTSDIYNNPIIARKRKGTPDDPYLPYGETLTIVNGKVSLTEVPNESSKLIVTDPSNFANLYYEIDDGSELLDNYFSVDYVEGVVFFNSANESKSLKFAYTGTGAHFFPAQRVWLTKDKNDVLLTIDEKFDDVDTAIDEQKARVDNLITSVPQPDEAIDARVDHDGTTFATLKDRIDNEQMKIEEAYEDRDGTKFDSLKDRIDAEQKKIEDAYTGHNGTLYSSLQSRLYNFDDEIKVFSDLILSVNEASYGAKGDGINDDTVAIQNAVAAAYAQSKVLYWPSGTYLTTSSIPNLHNVKHIGQGIIKRGLNSFYLNPTGNQTNTLYVIQTGGSVSNDGLDLSSSMNSLQTAFNALPNYGTVLNGIWQIQLDGSKYSGSQSKATIANGLRSVNPIYINGASVGGYPNVPTTIFEGGNASAVGISASYNVNLYVQNILFQNYNGSSSSGGIVIGYNSTVTTSNVHTSNCFYGISAEHQSAVNVPDGIHTTNGYLSNGTGGGAAIRSLMLCNHYIGIQNGTITTGAQFNNNYCGFVAQEASTGHVNFCTFFNNLDGVHLISRSRANLDGCVFNTNARGLRSDSLSHAFIPTSVVWGTGANANTVTVVTISGSQNTSTELISEYDSTYGISGNSFSVTYPNQTIASTTSTRFWTCTLKTPHWLFTPSSISIGRKIYFKIHGQITGTNSDKNIVCRISDGTPGANGDAHTSLDIYNSESGAFSAEGEIHITGNGTQYLFLEGSTHMGTIRKSRTKGTVTMANNTTLSLEASVSNISDSILIDTVEVGISG